MLSQRLMLLILPMDMAIPTLDMDILDTVPMDLDTAIPMEGGTWARGLLMLSLRLMLLILPTDMAIPSLDMDILDTVLAMDMVPGLTPDRWLTRILVK